MAPRRRFVVNPNPFVHTPQLETHILKSDKTYIITSFTAGSSHIFSAAQRLDTILRGHRVPFDILDAGTNPYAQKVVRIWAFKRRKAEEAKKAGKDGDIAAIPDPKPSDIAEPNLGTHYLPLLYVRDQMIGTFEEVLTLNEKGNLQAILWPQGPPVASINTTTNSVPGTKPTAAAAAVAAAAAAAAVANPPTKTALAPATSVKSPTVPSYIPDNMSALAQQVAAAAIEAGRVKQAEAQEDRMREVRRKREEAEKRKAKAEAEAEAEAEAKAETGTKAEAEAEPTTEKDASSPATESSPVDTAAPPATTDKPTTSVSSAEDPKTADIPPATLLQQDGDRAATTSATTTGDAAAATAAATAVPEDSNAADTRALSPKLATLTEKVQADDNAQRAQQSTPPEDKVAQKADPVDDDTIAAAIENLTVS